MLCLGLMPWQTVPQSWSSCSEATITYTKGQKNPCYGFLTFFLKRLGIFSPNFIHLLCVQIYTRVQIFIKLSAILTKLCHIKRDHPLLTICSNVHHRLKCTLAFSDIFDKQLGIFSPYFTHLLNVPVYARIQIFIQLPSTMTKLCHIKCDHPACISTNGGHFEPLMVVTLNMA